LRSSTTPGEATAFVRYAVTYVGDNCLIWPYAKSSDGRGQVYWDGKLKMVARVVCELANGPAPSPKHQAAHLCGRGNDACCNPLHLAWKTRKENEADKLIHGTRSRGEDSPTATISNETAQQIKALLPTYGDAAICRMLSVRPHIVRSIRDGRTWAWLE
jgi:hypothetical protein